MSELPPPVALDQPPGSPLAVAEAAGSARSAARALGDLAEQVTGARLPGWRGDDAEAVAQRCASVARLTTEVEEALHRSAARLAAHAELWTAVRARIAAMTAEQDEDFRRARPLDVGELDLADLTGSAHAEAQARLSSAEARRATEHASLVARLSDDAAATRTVLLGSLALVGAGGRHGLDGAVLHLAGALPGWGLPEISRRARALAWSLTGNPRDALHPSDVDALVHAELPFADHAQYAATFLDALGPQSLQGLLAAAWTGIWSRTGLPGLLGRVISGLDRTAATAAWLPTLLDDALAGGMHPGVVGGLAAALASARRQSRPGPPPALAAAWAGSLLAAERAPVPEAVPAIPPPDADPLTLDPLALLVDGILGQEASIEAAELMASTEAWAGVLGRGWLDHGELVERLVRTVADAPAEVARPALHSALLAIGTGLEDSDPADWPAQLLVVERAAPALSAAVTRHVDDVRELLTAAAAGVAGEAAATVLRGLSVVLATDGEAEGALTDALATAAAHPSAGGSASAVTVSTALAAVATHGRQLVLAMGEHRRKAESEARGALWDITFGIPFAVAGRVPVIGVIESLVTRGLGTNGYHVNQVRLEPGSSFPLQGPVTGAAEGGDRDREALLGTGVRAFLTTRAALGDIRLPEETDPGVLLDLLGAAAGDVIGGAVARRMRDRGLLGEGMGDVVGDEVAGLVHDAG